MSSRPIKSEQSKQQQQQIDMDSLFDFSQGTSQQSPITSSSNHHMGDSLSPYDNEERQQFNAPSHDYGQFRQQVGFQLANGNGNSSASQMNAGALYDGFNSGFGEMDFMTGQSTTYGFNSGLDFDADMAMDFPPAAGAGAMFFPSANVDASNVPLDFINPTTLAGAATVSASTEDMTSNVGRLWPGVHSEKAQRQAAMAKAAHAHQSSLSMNAAAAAQVHAQQRQLKMQAAALRQSTSGQGTGSTPTVPSSQQPQQQQLPQAQLPSQPQQTPMNAKRASHPVEPHVEESISRLLNQMRQNNGGMLDDDDEDGLPPHMARMKKDEEDMDEDERLLASEEGKKLSSKERRQLRNKVSARAFRSRRKEYIGQLEGEVALRTQESAALRGENASLRQENERYRGLIETLLRHPAFTPFINDISNDPSLLGVPQQHVIEHQKQQQQLQQMQARERQQQQQQQQHQQQQLSQPQPQQARDIKPDFLNFDASQLQIPPPSGGSNNQQQHNINIATVPSEPDFSKLHLNGFGSSSSSLFSSSANSVGAYLVLDVPHPIDAMIAEESEEDVELNEQNMPELWAKLGAAARRLEANSNGSRLA